MTNKNPNKNITWTKFTQSYPDELEGEVVFMSPMARIIQDFKFWVGHTDFPITEEVGAVINKCKGVEFLRVITNYRFMVGIGNLFVDRVVKENIANQLCATHKSQD
jgi:hypothetical protein